jgi:type VI secretion system protein ImpL
MLELLAILAPYALLVGIAVALIATIVLALLFLLLRRSAGAKDAKDPPAKAAGAPVLDAPAAGAMPLAELRQSFAAALRYLRRITPGYGWRYASPWYLVLGEKGAGKTSLLAELEALRPAGLMQAEPPLPGRALGWHFFDGGVVLDVAGQLVLDPARAEGDERAWRQLLLLLAEHRPVRPVDGIVLTVPCGDFIGPDRLDVDALLAKADRMHRHLLELQQRLGLKLPVYVVVSKCDWVPGFQSFWSEVAAARRDEIFGWSSGRDLEAEVTAEGFDRAFAGVAETLYRLHLDLAGKEAELADPEGALLFPTEFERLHEPLRLYCTSLFRQSVYHDAFFFRGLYFTGDGGPPPRRAAALLASPGHDRIPATAEQPQRWPLFARDLFAKKILREHNLAAIARSSQLPRSRPVRIAAACLAALVLIGGLGLVHAARQLSREAGSLMSPITFIAQSMSRAQQRASGAAAATASSGDATELLGMFARLDVEHLRSLWLPSSWFSGIDERIVEHFTVGFNTVILDAMRRAFDSRAEALIGDALAGRGKPIEGKAYALAAGPEMRRVAAYVDGLTEIEGAARTYDNLAASDRPLADVETLTAFLLDTKLPHDFFTNSALYGAALRHAVIHRFDPALYSGRAVAGLQALSQPVDLMMAMNGPITGRFTAVAAALDELDHAVAGRADAAAPLARLGAALAALNTMLADPDAAWMARAGVEGDPAVARLVTKISSSAFFGPGAAQALEQGLDRRLRRLQTELVQLRLRRSVPLLEQSSGLPALRLSPPAAGLAAALPPLLARAFMAPAQPRLIASPAPGTAGGWDPDRLAEAIALYRGYEQFQDGDLQLVPADFRRVVDAAARQRLNRNMTAAIANAEIVGAAAGTAQAGDSALFAATQAFGRAARPLGDLLSVLAQLNLNETYATLRDVTGRQAYGLLEQVDRLLEREQPYTMRSSIRPWNPSLPATLVAFGLQDDTALAQYLDTERGWVARLASDGAAPLLDYLARSDFTFGWRPTPLVPKWQRIVLELQKYQNSNPRNSVSALENFIRFDLAQVTRDNCVQQLSGDRYAATGDWFLERRSALRQGLLAQCGAIAGAAGMAAYAELADAFNRNLAGHYPFARIAAPDDAPAELNPILDYLRLYAGEAPAARRALAQGGTAAQQEALAFLDQMDKVRAFFAPFLADAGDDVPGYDVAVDFRVNRRYERGADQIIDWQVTVGDQVLHRGDPARPLRWHVSDPVAVSLRWAKDGPVAPVLEQVAKLEAPGRVMSWRYDDRWALLRLMMAHRTPATQLDRRAEIVPQVLEFAARTVSVVGPETKSPGPVGEARAFIRLRLSMLPPGAKAPVPIIVPVFPSRAPVLSGILSGEVGE